MTLDAKTCYIDIGCYVFQLKIFMYLDFYAKNVKTLHQWVFTLLECLGKIEKDYKHLEFDFNVVIIIDFASKFDF